MSSDDDIIPDLAAGCVLGLIVGAIGILFQLLRSRVGVIFLLLCVVIALVVALLPKIPPIEIPFGTIYVIKTNGANGRECPKQGCKSVVTFHAGDEINVLRTVQGEAIKGNSSWLLIWRNNVSVYIHSSLAAPIETPTTAPIKPTPEPVNPTIEPIQPQTYIINTNGARGRPCPQLSCDKPIVSFKKGDEIEVTGTVPGDAVKGNKDWLRVSNNNSTIYVHSSLASPRPLPTRPIPIPVPTPSQPTLQPLPDCIPPGCIPREHGDNARWWADKVEKGTCTGHKDEDWIVTYNTDNETWRNVSDIAKIRFDAPELNPLVRNSAKFARIGGINGAPPKIVLCVSDLDGALPEIMAWKTWVWLKP